MRKSKASRNPFLRILFLLYCGIMLYLLFFGSRQAASGDYWTLVKQNYNLRPFLTIGNYLHVLLYSNSAYMVRHCYINLAGNLLLFIPGGLLLPLLWPSFRKLGRFLFRCILVLLCIETAQLFSLLGSFDVDDVILNLIGLFIGYILYALSHRKKRK